MRSFTREIGPEIPGSLFAEQPSGLLLIHNHSQGNNLFLHKTSTRVLYINISQNMNPQTFSPPQSRHISGQQGLINYILTVDDRNLSGCGCIFEYVARVMVLAKCGSAASSALATFGSDSNQPIMTCQRRASESSPSDERIII